MASEPPLGSTLPLSSDPWSLLGRVRAFTVRVLYAGGAGHQSHKGTGVVEITRDAAEGEERVGWHESGRWQRGPLTGIAFHNATLWRRRRGSDVVELSHLRRGVHQPTLLVELRPDSATSLVSVAPHHCGPDRYAARLRWDARALYLTWDVESPTDPYRLEWTGHLCRLFAPSFAL